MKAIDPKKLIVSTLIFLFSSFHQPLLSDTVALQSQQAEVALTKAKQQVTFGVPNIITVNQNSVSVRTVTASPLLLNELYTLVPKSISPILVTGPYTDLQAGYVWYPEKSQNSLALALLPSLQLFQAQFYPKIISSPQFASSLFLLPPWNVGEGEVQMLTLGFMLFSCYLAFCGYRERHGTEIHSMIAKELSLPTLVVQTLAANLAEIDKVFVHTAEKELFERAKAFLEARRGQSVLKILSDLLR